MIADKAAAMIDEDWRRDPAQGGPAAEDRFVHLCAANHQPGAGDLPSKVEYARQGQAAKARSLLLNHPEGSTWGH